MARQTVQTIYFDESGYTGNDLLNVDQPVFVYASVAVEPSQAAYLRDEVKSRFRIEEKELKGKNLVGYHRGKEAISWLLNECKDVACIVIADKKYTLAGKFFEYIFEPVLQTNNSLFYAVRFHRFIANFLYMLFVAKDKTAEDILIEFDALMRNQDTEALERMILPTGRLVTVNEPLGQIMTFILCHRDRIKEEIAGLSDAEAVRKWSLELTTTSLYWTLSYWSERFDIMDVYCDNSKPLYDNRYMFDALIGRQDKIYMKLGSEPERALTFNLAGPITLLDSQQSPGIQIADILSSSIAYAIKNPEDTLSKTWNDLAGSMYSPLCILPDLQEIDLHKKGPLVNALILDELVNRTLRGENLLDGMREFIHRAYILYELSPPKFDES